MMKTKTVNENLLEKTYGDLDSYAALMHDYTRSREFRLALCEALLLDPNEATDEVILGAVEGIAGLSELLGGGE